MLLAASGACADGGGGAAPPAERIAMTLSSGGCEPASLALEPGRYTFVVGNPRSSNVTTFEVRSAEARIASVNNVLGGLTRDLTVELEEGRYTMRCRGGGTGGDGDIVVTAPR